MAVKRYQNPGRTPSQVIVSKNKRLGFPGQENQQATTRVIFDSQPLVTSTSQQTYTFFKDCRTRKFPFTNLTENKLQINESIVLQRMSVFIMICTTGTLNVTNVIPLSYFAAYQRLYSSFVNFQLSNNQILKDFPLHQMFACFNPHSKFMGAAEFQPAAGDLLTNNFAHDIFHFDNESVIPPQVEFEGTIQVPALTVQSGVDSFLVMELAGLGSLYAPKHAF